MFNARLGTPVRVNVLSGVVSTAFMLSAEFLNTGSNATTFVVVLYMATSTGLLSYLLIFPAVIRLRYTHPDVPRPYRIPYGNTGAWIGGLVTLGWIVLGSWIAVFPDTIENAVGAGYNFESVWGISPAALRGVHPGDARRDRRDRPGRLRRRGGDALGAGRRPVEGAMEGPAAV